MWKIRRTIAILDVSDFDLKQCMVACRQLLCAITILSPHSCHLCRWDIDMDVFVADFSKAGQRLLKQREGLIGKKN